MSEVFLRPLEAMSALRQVVADNDEQRDAHRAEVPDFPVAAAGRNFGGHGERIRDVLARIHERGGQRLDNLSATAHAAHEQVRAFADFDESFGSSFARGREAGSK
ncbi:hypothetical protein QP943_07130 [Corynebacterium kefirresidentii]|uniref:ESX-1 secretion-associated protein n=2 Tax=Corynebacteriaceae TaxID=1653 RepID=A0ABT8Q3K1_9CORY|nr:MULTISPECIES: hypothetical protein [Corynebacterium]WKS54508.1 hypothetical protein NLL48_05050 [Corynebacterium tuberculostearicum]ERS48871.1 hypothetical protein HMPREF1282_00828 [Corynebacterium sp. KPL1856]ERS49400.1 hypothetical protein HMPREF1286_00845 [Corynebacterium sp. KPL1860]ERS54079.1 hypothetical protein HMPREF1264_01690 [Corynebacterium sp. KPL1821]ERS60293.1 hypothetical protein HMPREF1260_01389 [Corynebacterium sp. KPL1817]